MIDKLLGRDNTEELTEELVEEPAEQPVSKKESGKSGLTVAIEGLWAGRAGDVNPKKELELEGAVPKLFYMIRSSGKGFGEQRHYTTVSINGSTVVVENGTIKEGDPTDTGVIPLPIKFQKPGVLKVTIALRTWEGVDFYKSPEFTVTIT